MWSPLLGNPLFFTHARRDPLLEPTLERGREKVRTGGGWARANSLYHHRNAAHLAVKLLSSGAPKQKFKLPWSYNPAQSMELA